MSVGENHFNTLIPYHGFNLQHPQTIHSPLIAKDSPVHWTQKKVTYFGTFYSLKLQMWSSCIIFLECFTNMKSCSSLTRCLCSSLRSIYSKIFLFCIVVVTVLVSLLLYHKVNDLWKNQGSIWFLGNDLLQHIKPYEILKLIPKNTGRDKLKASWEIAMSRI